VACRSARWYQGVYFAQRRVHRQYRAGGKWQPGAGCCVRAGHWHQLLRLPWPRRAKRTGRLRDSFHQRAPLRRHVSDCGGLALACRPGDQTVSRWGRSARCRQHGQRVEALPRCRGHRRRLPAARPDHGVGHGRRPVRRAQCVVECAGGRVIDLQGRPLAYNKPDLHNPWFVVDAGGYDWRPFLVHAAAAETRAGH